MADGENVPVEEMGGLALQRKGRRGGVKAERLDPDAAMSRKAKVVPKPEEDVQFLTQTLKKNFLFQEQEARTGLVNAMFSINFSKDHVIIEQGEPGDNFYVLQDGTCDCFVDGTLVTSYKSGATFGELALMYNSPRQATVKTTSEVKCWAVARDIFKTILLSSAIKKRDMYEAFLGEVPLLRSLSDYERNMLADALCPEDFAPGDVVVEQGKPGDKFYIVESGKFDIVKDLENMGELGSGAYFGELALLNSEPRAASVIAKTAARVLVVDRVTFTSGLMASTHDLLKQNAKRYATTKLTSMGSMVLLDPDDDSD